MKIKTFATFTHRQLDKQVNRFLKNDIHVLEIQTHSNWSVSYTHLRAHETCADRVCRLLLEKKNKH
ncbi:hypothetical protein, partial [Staphylococcus aureus]